MLKTHKNQFLQIIEANKLDPFLFEAIEITEYTKTIGTAVIRATKENPAFQITFRDTVMKFWVICSTSNFHNISFSFRKYAPAPLTEGPSSWVALNHALEQFQVWLNSIHLYLEESITPDLWSQLNNQRSIINSLPTDKGNTENFSIEEKVQLRLAVHQFRLLITENFDPTEEQLQMIDERLDYLSESIDRLNRFDWKSVALSTIIGIATTLSLDTQTGRVLYQLFLQAFRSTLYLLTN